MLELKKVSAGYGRLPVLFDIDLTVEQGQMVSVLGSNGAGKSTLLKTILGAIPPTRGEIIFRRNRISSTPAHKRVGMGIALSPEGRQIFPTLTVRENLVTGAYGVNGAKMKEQFERVYELFPRLKERQNQAGGSLSGGEQQMLAVSRALMSRPRLLLVDELSLGLAPVIAERLYAALRALCDEGLSVIMVEQFHLVAVGFSDKQMVMEKGRFVRVTEEKTAMAQMKSEHTAHTVVPKDAATTEQAEQA
jgi:branched-chain amino acid transport system ATP-binding protein